MDFSSVSRVALSNPSQQLVRLCKHMGHKIPAAYSETEGELKFEFGACKLSAADNQLAMYCEANSLASLDKMQDIMGRHLEQLAWKDEPKVTWHNA